MDRTSYIAKQVTQAVAYLHNLEPPIVHRDIKPANILVETIDIWSLACTLLELLTFKDCWEDLIAEMGSIDEPDDNYQVNCMMTIFRRKRCPKSLELLASNSSTSALLMKCFDYEPCERPRAIDLVNALSAE